MTGAEGAASRSAAPQTSRRLQSQPDVRGANANQRQGGERPLAHVPLSPAANAC